MPRPFHLLLHLPFRPVALPVAVPLELIAADKQHVKTLGKYLRIARHTLALILLMLVADLCLLVSMAVRVFDEGLAWGIACWTA